MLAEARKKGVYGQFFKEYIGDKKLPIQDGESAYMMPIAYGESA